ncbi:hypothetical protein K502DRAFT_271510, partial [Neoconidiobolus thromboides FSU 785]
EIEIIYQHYLKLIENGILPSQIAILSPYNAQVTQLKLKFQEIKELEIGTIDGFQGREKEVICLSLVRSNNQNQVGFLLDYRRMNVAITRAKRQLFIIADSNTVFNNKLQPTDKGCEFLLELGIYLNTNADILVPEM